MEKQYKKIKAQVIGKEKQICIFCKRETSMQILYVKNVQKLAAIGAPLGIPGIIASSLIINSLSTLKGHVFLQCDECKRPLFVDRSTENQLKTTYTLAQAVAAIRIQAAFRGMSTRKNLCKTDNRFSSLK